MKINSPNIILQRGQEHGFLFKDVNNFSCIHCDKEYPLNTKEKLYLLNAHGWVICTNDMKFFRSK